jgi:hypothetical protein
MQRALPWLLVALCACTEAAEPPQLTLPVHTDPSTLVPVTTDLGWTVTLDHVELALRDLAFTVAGEVHTGATWREWLAPRALAHPGHFEGGTVTGELAGAWRLLLHQDQALGDATLLAGDYTAVDFTFDQVPGLVPNDPTTPATLHLRGTAARDGASVPFVAVVVAPQGRRLVGAPFEARIRPDTAGTILFRFEPRDPFDGDTAFDGVDFGALAPDPDGVLRLLPGGPHPDAWNTLRRHLLTHDHYRLLLGP